MQFDRIIPVPIIALKEFKDHPFKVEDNDDMKKLVESIKVHGLINPIVIRPTEDGNYEIVSGHRRTYACHLLGMKEIPAIIRKLTDDQAIIAMVDANLQRESLLPSEKAFAYKMKLDALNRQGFRSDLTSDQVGPKSSIGEIADTDSASQIKRYVRLTYLVPELLAMVDSKQIPMGTAVCLSFLKPNEQRLTGDAIQKNGKAPSMSQASKMKELSLKRELNAPVIKEIMEGEKAGKGKRYIQIPYEDIVQFFKPDATEKQIHRGIIYALDVVSKNTKAKEEKPANEKI